ncbi:MAG: HDIG domain-containing protein [Nitrospirae bacterium]|nr:MAG: HDIG domain-containing protein [Nitrospirota bacterium]
MKDTKNGSQKTAPIKKPKSLVERLNDYRDSHKDDMSKVFVLLVLGLVSAFIIAENRNIDSFVGSFLIAAFILLFFYKDIRRYKPLYLKDYKMLLLLGLLVSGTLLLGRVSAYLLSGLQRGLDLPGGDTSIFGIPIPLGAMLVAMIFDFHTAMTFSFAISLLSGIWLNNPYIAIYAFFGSLTAAFSVIRCKKRSALIKGGLWVSLVNITAAEIIVLTNGTLFSPEALYAFMFALISGIFVAALISVLLPILEFIFGITTDISLIELLDLDQPLMKSLMINAPGTYHHSVITGTLAESAAEAVGANPLLARVCSYYHDIGKIKMPEYFVENQRHSISKHDKLTPSMSSIILTAHVKEGIELGKQYKLPQSVMDIIRQHHGTSLITYFYQKALESNTEGGLSKESYRYPGPKPQSRVAALVMMADAVEAASRSLTDPTPARISALVDRIINNIFLDGQIDECELTLKDLSEIKKRFNFILTSIFHKRIEYPEIDQKNLTHKADISLVEAAPEKNTPKATGNGNINKEPSKDDKDKPAENKKNGQQGTSAFSPDR